ncbi:Protein ANTI-SILENCING 1 [Linum perenne]
MVEVDEQGTIEIRWTSERRLGGKNRDLSFYESFIYDGEEYKLYDSVYVYTNDDDEPEIGKLVKAWETSNGEKKVRILWFFRPRDITNYLKGETLFKNELFLGAGQGKGLVNNNHLEVIAGKCNVICISRDKRNPQPSEEQISNADFVFSRAFDVGQCEILERMDDKIGGTENYLRVTFLTIAVKFLFNRFGREAPRDVPNSGSKRKEVATDVHRSEEGPKRKKFDAEPGRLSSAKLPKPSQVQSSDACKKTANQLSELPVIDKTKWFKAPIWEEEMKAGFEDGSLVLLLNLSPSYTSVEVQELIKDSCMESCSAKMVQRTAFSSPHSGQAFVKFVSKEVAERVISKLTEGCLLLPGGRSVVGRIMSSGFKGKQSAFYGHFCIDKLKHQKQRTAVSTSHCSQPNTIEYEMALEWCLLQTKMQKTWDCMHKQHGEDLRRLKSSLTSSIHKTK